VLVALDEKSISRRHATFICDEPIREYYLKDLNSSFGTSVLINGAFEKLTPDKQERIYNEDVVQFGNVVTVRLLLPCETRASMTSL
jgi:pSer/pThr/pTyr-binding forkhead associated (FHA) protein